MLLTRLIIYIVLFFLSHSLMAGDQLVDPSQFLLIGSKDGSNSIGIGGYIGNELYNEIEDKNNIFKESDIKLDLDLGGFANFETKWSRRVFNYHKVDYKKPTYTPDDMSKFIVVNTIFAKIGAGRNHKFFKYPVGMGAEYGILFSVGQLKTPKDSQEGSPYDNRNADSKTNARFAKKDMTTLMQNEEDCFSCEKPEKTIDRIKYTLKNIWLSAIGFAENVIDYIIKPFIDSEKLDEYNQEPMKALKLQALYGMPLDVNVFMQKDQRLKTRDIVKNTSFFTFSPIGLGVEFVSGIKSGGSIFVRYIEEISMQKLADNRVTLQVKYIKSYGGNIQYAKLRPSLSIGLGYTILDWDTENYDSTQYKFVFEYDLNNPEAKQALSKVIKNNYIIDFIDIVKEEYKIELPDGVTFIDATRNSAKSRDGSYKFRLPRYAKTHKHDITNVNKEDRMNPDNKNTQYIAERLIGQVRKRSSFSKLLWKDKDYNLRGHVRLQSAPGQPISVNSIKPLTTNKNFVVTMTSLFNTKHGGKSIFNDLIDLDKKILDIDEDNKAHTQLREVAATLPEKNQPLSYSFTLTLNIQHIVNILSYSYDEIMQESAALFLGEKHRNEWVKNKAQWRSTRRGPSGKINRSRSTRRYSFKCMKDWENQFRIAAAHKFSLRNTCIEYYRWSEKIARSITEARKTDDLLQQINYLIHSFDGIEMMPVLQLLTSRVAGGYVAKPNYNSVRFASEFFAEELMLDKYLHKNGELYVYPYDFNIDTVPDIEHIEDSRDRMVQAKVYVDKSTIDSPYEYYMVIKAFKPFIQNENINMSLKLDIRKHKKVLADIPKLTSHFQRLPDPIPMSPVGGQWTYYKYFFKLNFTAEEREIIDTLKKGKQYSVLATVVNDDGHWVSEQSELLIEIPKQKHFDRDN